VPSAAILRQCPDAAPAEMDERLHEANVRLPEAHGKPLASAPRSQTRWGTRVASADTSENPVRIRPR
jgi:hypothetical protein